MGWAPAATQWSELVLSLAGALVLMVTPFAVFVLHHNVFFYRKIRCGESYFSECTCIYLCVARKLRPDECLFGAFPVVVHVTVVSFPDSTPSFFSSHVVKKACFFFTTCEK